MPLVLASSLCSVGEPVVLSDGFSGLRPREATINGSSFTKILPIAYPWHPAHMVGDKPLVSYTIPDWEPSFDTCPTLIIFGSTIAVTVPWFSLTVGAISFASTTLDASCPLGI